MRAWRGIFFGVFAACAGLHASAIGLNFTGTTLADYRTLSGSPNSALRPPDTIGAVGLSHIVEMTNGTFAIYNKSTGALVSRVLDQTFWTNAGFNPGAGNLSDPRVIYDISSNRWFAAQITVDNTGNRVLLARTNTSDPTGTWQMVMFTGNSGFADYPTLSVDALGVYIGTNNFTDSSGSFTGVSLFSIPKADILAGTPSIANMSSFENLSSSTYGFTLQGALDFGASKGHGSIVARGPLTTNLIRFDVNNPGAAGATLGTATPITVNARGFQPLGAQPDGTTDIDTLDRRISASAVQVGSLLYIVQTHGVAGRSALRWTVLNEATNAVLAQGDIADSNFDLYYGAISANLFGDVVIAYSRSGTGAGDFIGSYASIGRFDGVNMTFDTPLQLRAGLANYHLGGGTDERWGDYSAVVRDPSDPTIFWAFQEFAGLGNVWSTQISELITTPEAATWTLVVILIPMWAFRRRIAAWLA
ncbi:MAG: hypothetical protein HYR60_19760 [Acidobacteria bacterium]|nr:hypothetical protein [Acidobacteriota bacterium]MBI3472600.1 hypothetical protein [Candidatus Solibacter usitatus]